jgi:hypothetical protein
MWSGVGLIGSDDSEEDFSYFFRVGGLSKLGAMLAMSSKHSFLLQFLFRRSVVKFAGYC